MKRDHHPDDGNTQEADSVPKLKGLAMLEQKNCTFTLETLLQVVNSWCVNVTLSRDEVSIIFDSVAIWCRISASPRHKRIDAV